MFNYYKDSNTKGMAITATVLAGILIAVLIFFGVTNAQEKQAMAETQIINYYALTAKVIELDRAEDVVVVEDSTGNAWAFYGVEDWQEGDCVSMVMDSRGTESITDDEIITAQYNSWTIK